MFTSPRQDKTTPIFGDIFNHENGSTFTLFDIHRVGYFGFIRHKDGTVFRKRFDSLKALYNDGFEPDIESLEYSFEIAPMYLFAPRKLEDDTWTALHPLLYSTALCVDFDDMTLFTSRYCFDSNDMFNSQITALYWLTRMNNANSLPVCNIAYRGFLGTEAIISHDITSHYYQTLINQKYSDNNKELKNLQSEIMKKLVTSI